MGQDLASPSNPLAQLSAPAGVISKYTYVGWLSMIDNMPDVGITRVRENPALDRRSVNSDSIRSRPVGAITSIFKSISFPGSGSLGGFRTESTISSTPSDRIARRQFLRI